MAPGRVAGPRLARGSPPSGRSRSRTPRSREPADEVRRAGQLGRDRDEPEPVDERLERRARRRRPGPARWAGSWAPRRAAARNGPSRLNPSGSAPSAGRVRQPGADASANATSAAERRGHGGRQERGHAAPQQARGPCRRGRPDRPSRRGRPSRGRGRRRTRGDDTGRPARGLVARGRPRRSARPRW